MKLICFSVLAITLAFAAGCNSSAPSATSTDSRPEVANVAISETRAANLLQAALQDQKVADLDCLAFSAESEPGPSKKAAEWEFAARELHNAKCGGDPSTEPVRDRYRIKSNGEVAVYDPASDEYKAFQ